MTEFNLSEKIHIEYDFKDENKELQGMEVISKEDVKEFIRRLKEELVCPNCGCVSFNRHKTEIDKLAGDELSK